MGKIYKCIKDNPSLLIYEVTLSILSKSLFLYIFTIILYRKDKTGVSSAFTVLLGLIAVSLSGLVAPFLLKKFKGYKLGELLVLGSLIIIASSIFETENKIYIYACIVLLFLIQGIESANYNFEVTNIFEVGSKRQFKTNNTFHILVELFSMTAPIVGFVLVNFFSLNISIIIILFIQLVPGLAWMKLKNFEPARIGKISYKNISIFKTYKNVLKNKGVVYLNLVRTFNGFIFNTWSITVPLIIASIARDLGGNVSFLQSSYEFIASISFIISGIFLGEFLKSPKYLTVLYKLVPFIAAVGVIFCLLYKRPYSIYLATAILGVSVYFFRVGTATIGQVITKKDLIAESVVLGDVFSRFVNFLTTSLFFILLKFVNYDIIVIIFIVVGAVGNILFVNLPLEDYEKDLTKSVSQEVKD